MTRLKPIIGILTLLLIPVSLLISPAFAVEKGKTSYTAEAVCAFRSIAALDPDPKTRNPDHMAKHFVNPELKGRFPGLGLTFDAAKVAMDMQDTGVFYYVNARTHHMDQALQQALENGTSQVVILGAGFDSRAYRFHAEFPQVRFYEVDLPATSADKQQRVEKILGQTPDWVRFTPIDFNTQTLDEVLTQVGFSKQQKTFYLWEGVTYFISEAAVNGTLAFIAEHSAPGSQVMFDYMLADVVQGRDYTPYGARRTVFFVSTRGEPYVFGITPYLLETFVNRQGLTLRSDLGPAQLSERYLMDSQGQARGKIAEFLRIALIEVPRKSQQTQLKEMASKDQVPPLFAGDLKHQVPVPADVQRLLDRQEESFLQEDRVKLMSNYSDDYLGDGYRKVDVNQYLNTAFRLADFQQFKIVLTRFDQQGDRAWIDGFVQRNGYRTPLMIPQMIRESDGYWRWYGNQK